jgi:FKBP-type peptidyl-prolyl cis-trans isomerase SlyD
MDAQNRPLDELKEPVEFFVGGDDLLAKVEEALLEHAAGDELNLHLEPEHAFGDYRAELVCFEDRALFPAELEVGMAFEGLPEGAKTSGMPADAIYLVSEIYDSHVVLDGNHPLAGMALRLHMKVRRHRGLQPVQPAGRQLARVARRRRRQRPNAALMGAGRGGLSRGRLRRVPWSRSRPLLARWPRNPPPARIAPAPPAR